MGIGLGLSNTGHGEFTGGGGPSGGPSTSTYYRTEDQFQILRPDGSSSYLRP